MKEKVFRTILIVGLVLCLFTSVLPYGATKTGKTLTNNLDNLSTFVSQPPSEEWNKTFGGPDDDGGYAVRQTSDGGYIIVGYTLSYGVGETDVWLIKTDSNGNEEWNKTFGGSNIDAGTDVQQTGDGGYIITGITTLEGHYDYDMLLIKINANGDKEWIKSFRGGSGHDAGLAVRQTDDGGYIVVGYTSSYDTGYDVWLIKIDKDGKKEWDKRFGGHNDDIGECIQQTSDGGYIIVGLTKSYGHGGYDVWLIKLDSEWDEEWNRTFGGNENDYGFSVQQTSDGGYIIAGNTRSYGSGSSDIWLIKTDSNGNEEWNKTFGGKHYDEIETPNNAIQQTSDGGYIIVGRTTSYGCGKEDVWLIKVAPANRPPSTPNTPQGETNVTPLKKYTYTTVSADPDGDEIYYMFDWGDGTTSGWLGPYKSGETVKVSHRWTKSGVYEIKVKAKDSNDVESGWSEPLQVTVQSTLLEKIYNMLPEFLRNIILRILDLLSS